MYAAAARCEIFMPAVQSLKEKRRVIKPVVEGLRRRFGVSVAEVDHLEAWQRAAVAVAIVTSHPERLQASLIAVRDFVDRSEDLELLSFEVTHLESA